MTADLIDRVIEAPIVTSFTALGYNVRRRIDGWRSLDTYDLSGRVIAITGPTSGLGEAAARQFARCGATLILLARDEEKVSRLVSDIRSSTGNDEIRAVIVDLGERTAIHEACAAINDDYQRLDVLIHNAGALFNDRRSTPDGLELTVAVQVVGPFLMTGLLFELLESTPGSRVLTMASGGMYTAGLTVGGLQMDEDSYRGTEQYARAKRAQVTLNEMWAERAGEKVTFHALHPGWADTPGVEASLPGFRKVVGPLLRTPDQGADTLVWLAADDGEPLAVNGEFWLDRRTRSIHKLGSTRKTDTPARRAALWSWVAEQAGWNLPA